MAATNMAPPMTHHRLPPSSTSSFPILAVSILGILTTAILLVSYYVFVIKCCLNCHRSDMIGRLQSRRHRGRETPFRVYASAAEDRGLEESVIRAIPIIRFRRGDGDVCEQKKSLVHECAVCLNEFQEQERLRLLPNCSHVFHIDCIDTWLQTNANCPLCRSEITNPVPTDQFEVPLQVPHLRNSFLVQVRDDSIDLTPRTEVSAQSTIITIHQDPSPLKPEQRSRPKGVRKFHRVSSMGDECIDMRGKDDEFSIQPMRRSFSMDSSCDRQLYLSVQEILQQKHEHPLLQEVGIGDGSSSNTCVSDRVRLPVFSFGHGWSSRNTALPNPIQP